MGKSKNNKATFGNRLGKWFVRSHRQTLVMGLIVGLLVGGGGTYLTQRSSAATIDYYCTYHQYSSALGGQYLKCSQLIQQNLDIYYNWRKGNNYLLPGQAWLTQDGYYGPLTAGQVEVIQRAFGLTVDGVVGPQTWRKMCYLAQQYSTPIMGWTLYTELGCYNI